MANIKLTGTVIKAESRFTPQGKQVLEIGLSLYTGGNKEEGYKKSVWVNVAVTSDGRPVNIYANPNNSGSGEIGKHDPSLGVQVESINLVDFCKDFDRIALLKIDCEGSEYEILSGQADFLKKVDHIRGEFHGSREKVEGLLTYCQEYCKDVKITKLITR